MAMILHITGKHVDIGNALQEHLNKDLTPMVEKYFPHAIDAHVVLSRQGPIFEVDITIDEGSGHKTALRSEAHGDDIHYTVDTCIRDIEKNLRKYKERLRSHHKQRLNAQKHDFDAISYTIAPEEESETGGADVPVVIAEEPMLLEHMSVSDAIMRLELSGKPAVIFVNRGSEKLNVIYYRKDGNIAWIEVKGQFNTK